MSQTEPAKDQPPAQKRKKITSSYLENAGAYYLERFPASIFQFHRVMEQKIYKSCKDHPEQSHEECLLLLDKVIEKFIKIGYLNDENYAHALLYSLEQRGFSRMRIQLVMKNKGLSPEIINSTLPESDPDKDRKAALRWAKKKRLGPFSTRIADNNLLQRGLSSLARAGFGYDIASWVMSLSQETAHSLLENENWTESDLA